LGCGIAVVANSGVGDTDTMLETAGGLLVQSFQEAELAAAVEQLKTLSRRSEAARLLAESIFSLDVGVARYRGIYEGVEQPGPA
jgi:glycosyltransferase involved in cell wall biosynthesis